MPRLDLILLPLLGGYIFLITFNLTRYYHVRIAEKQRLVYNSLVSAFLLAIIVYLIDYVILRSNIYVDLYCFKSKPFASYRTHISRFINNVLNNVPATGLKHSLLIFLVSYPLAKVLNIFFNRKFSFDFTIRRWGSQFDRLIWFSLTEKSDEDKLLMITTKSNKVYIGYVSKLSEPIGETYITILPNLSGFRSKDTLKLEITTNYTDVIKKYVEEDKADEIDDKLGVILPVSEILIISRFDNDIFGRFNENNIPQHKEQSAILGFVKSLIKRYF